MKSKTILACAAVFFAGYGLGFAADPNLGTWRLDEVMSHLGPGAPKNTIVVYVAVGDSIKATVDGVDKDGKPTHNEWTGKFDGKDYPVKGDPTSDTRAYKQRDAYTLEVTAKKGGKETLTGTIVLDTTGKKRLVTLKGTDASGKEFTSTTVYDKQ